MKRVGFILKVKQEKIEEYKEWHRNVWPEVLDALKRNGWHNYTLFMRPDGLLFGYCEASDSFEASLAGMATEPASLKWQELMKPYFEALDGKRPFDSRCTTHSVRDGDRSSGPSLAIQDVLVEWKPIHPQSISSGARAAD